MRRQTNTVNWGKLAPARAGHRLRRAAGARRSAPHRATRAALLRGALARWPPFSSLPADVSRAQRQRVSPPHVRRGALHLLRHHRRRSPRRPRHASPQSPCVAAFRLSLPATCRPSRRAVSSACSSVSESTASRSGSVALTVAVLHVGAVAAGMEFDRPLVLRMRAEDAQRRGGAAATRAALAHRRARLELEADLAVRLAHEECRERPLGAR